MPWLYTYISMCGMHELCIIEKNSVQMSKGWCFHWYITLLVNKIEYDKIMTFSLLLKWPSYRCRCRKFTHTVKAKHQVEMIKKSYSNGSVGSLLYEPPHDKTSKMAHAPSKDSDQPGRIRVFAVRMKKAWVLSLVLSCGSSVIDILWTSTNCGATL